MTMITLQEDVGIATSVEVTIGKQGRKAIIASTEKSPYPGSPKKYHMYVGSRDEAGIFRGDYTGDILGKEDALCWVQDV